MEKKVISSTFSVFRNLGELPSEIQTLFEQAIVARDKAYAPYSNYFVGAAILLESGEIITGSNQENAAYPSGLCAERTAIFYAGANYPDQKIKSMAISVKSLEKTVDSPGPPCGACRQSIAEYEFKQQQDIEIYMSGETGKILKSDSLLNLLPLAFNSSFL
ncbi:MAG TPA: cytidine deaminase [Flavobacteriaceae bacterium]|nr:cytidine deaminase [Flavobacteriaceae bacterium]